MSEGQQARLVVRIKPNARQNRLVGFKDGVLQISVAAPPADGKANEALIKFLSDQLGVSKSMLAIEKSRTTRIKTITVQGLSQPQAVKLLERLTG